MNHYALYTIGSLLYLAYVHAAFHYHLFSRGLAKDCVFLHTESQRRHQEERKTGSLCICSSDEAEAEQEEGG